jgi:hypothetical protein
VPGATGGTENLVYRTGHKKCVALRKRFNFTERHTVVLLRVQNIKSISVQTQLNSIYYIELHVSAYFRRFCTVLDKLTALKGRAMTQAVSRRPLTTEARVRSQVKSM